MKQLKMEERKINGYTRPIAVKVTIKEVLEGEYILENEQNPNYLLVEGKKIYRLNLFATILGKEKQGSITNFLLDDGTGTIVLRAFEESKSLEELNIGETITIIGRVRIYNEEKYLSPEIIKKANPLWLKVRALELNFGSKKIEKEIIAQEKKSEEKKSKEKIEEEVLEEEINESDEEKIILPTHKLIKIIKELDSGNGVLIEEVIEKSPLNETEKILEKMLQNGDIFQIMPGKVKVL